MRRLCFFRQCAGMTVAVIGLSACSNLDAFNASSPDAVPPDGVTVDEAPRRAAVTVQSPVPHHPPEPASPDPARLMGLTAADVQKLMGTPGLVRRENTAQVMQFEGKDCVLDVILYEPQPGAHFRTQYVEARNGAGEKAPVEMCMAGLIPRQYW